MTPAAVSNQVVIERIETVRAMLESISGKLDKHIEAQAASERDIALKLQEIDSRSLAAHRRIDQHDQDIKNLAEQVQKLSDAIQPLVFANKILTWVAVGFGSSIIALIWGIITDRVSLVIP